MLIVTVYVSVKPEHIDAFRAATLENAKASIREPGIARFDVLEEVGQKGRFVLIEAYRTDKDPALHKETAHYKHWRDTVEPMMLEPRKSVKYADVFYPTGG